MRNFIITMLFTIVLIGCGSESSKEKGTGTDSTCVKADSVKVDTIAVSK